MQFGTHLWSHIKKEEVYLVFNTGNWSPGDNNRGARHVSGEMRGIAHWRVCKNIYVLVKDQRSMKCFIQRTIKYRILTFIKHILTFKF